MSEGESLSKSTNMQKHAACMGNAKETQLDGSI
jgi:hypothetical protein